MAKETAEQKLLKLIEAEEGSGGKVDVARDVAHAVKGKSFDEMSVPGFAKSIPGLLQSFPPVIFSGLAFNLKHVNTLLVLMIIFVLAALTVSIARGVRSITEGVAFGVDVAPPARGVPSAAAVIPGVDLHFTGMSARNIFAPGERKAIENKPVFPNETRMILTRVTDFRLVGISWLNAPETATAMIEDQKTFVTYFLKQGEELNGVTVEQIYADRVILSFAGEKLILKL